MYNNTKKSYRKIYRKGDKDRAYSEEFLLISTGIVVVGFLCLKIYIFLIIYNIIVGELRGNL